MSNSQKSKIRNSLYIEFLIDITKEECCKYKDKQIEWI